MVRPPRVLGWPGPGSSFGFAVAVGMPVGGVVGVEVYEQEHPNITTVATRRMRRSLIYRTFRLDHGVKSDLLETNLLYNYKYIFAIVAGNALNRCDKELLML